MVGDRNIEPGTNSKVDLRELEVLLRNFEAELQCDDLRSKVLSMVSIFRHVRRLGRALIPSELASAARDRILYYFRKYPETVIDGDELLVVSGIQEYARRLRELRVEFGWAIASGITIREMLDEDPDAVPSALRSMKPDEYVLLNIDQDLEAAHRWNIANSIRKQRGSVRDKLLQYLRSNVGKAVTNEELRYVAGHKTEWARRVRELRTEFGWPVVTKTTGRPNLKVGAYMLESDRQSPEHDRAIPDHVRRDVLRRDGYRCQECHWSHDQWNRSDPRHLELHHVRHHARGGDNTAENLKTLCTVCHDTIHRMERSESENMR